MTPAFDGMEAVASRIGTLYTGETPIDDLMDQWCDMSSKATPSISACIINWKHEWMCLMLGITISHANVDENELEKCEYVEKFRYPNS